MPEDDLDDNLLQSVRDAILKAGGVPAVAEQTGIPKKTLEKYLGKTSMPSLANAAKIARAGGTTLDGLVRLRGEERYRLSIEEVAKFAARVVMDIHMSLLKVYHEEKVHLPPGGASDEAYRLFDVVLLKLDGLGDLNEARALMPWLENKIRAELREAKGAPGTGKREAS